MTLGAFNLVLEVMFWGSSSFSVESDIQNGGWCSSGGIERAKWEIGDASGEGQLLSVQRKMRGPKT